MALWSADALYVWLTAGGNLTQSGYRARIVITPTTPRALLVNLARSYGGATARVLALAHALGPETASVGCLMGSPTWVRAREMGVPCETLGSASPDPRIVLRLRSIARSGDYNLVDSQNTKSRFWITAPCAGKITLVSTLNSWVGAEYGAGLAGRAFRAIERWSYPSAQRFIAVSQDIRTHLLRLGVPSDHIDVIPNAVSVPEKVDVDRSAFLNRYGIPEGARVCCAVGRLVYAKGYSHLVDAMSRLGEQIHCVIAGDGKDRDDLNRLIREMRLEDRVHLVGDLKPPEVLELLAVSDLFVMSSVSEGTPVALLEAGGVGKAIVATGVGGIPEMVQDGKEAILVPPADRDALAVAIEKVLGDDELRRRLGCAVANRVRSEFSLEAQAEATRRCYAAALEQYRRAQGVQSR